MTKLLLLFMVAGIAAAVIAGVWQNNVSHWVQQ